MSFAFRLLTAACSVPARRLVQAAALPLVLLLALPPAASAGDAVSAGAAYLKTSQAQSGLWSRDTERAIADTAEAVAALFSIGTQEAAASALSGAGALLLAIPAQAVTTRDRAVLLAVDGKSEASLLLDVQNADGGWGAAPGKASDALDSALAAEALLARKAAPEGGWAATADFLMKARGADGCWQLADEAGGGALALTARVVRVLAALQATGLESVEVTQTLNSAAALLRGALRSDGRFSLESGTAGPASPVTSAEAYRAAILFDPPAVYSDTLELLRGLQQASGAWREPGKDAQDVYTTALALEALTAIKAPPASARADLALTAQGVSFNPALPNSGDSVTITAVVFNRGAMLAQNAAVAFYHGDPRQGGTLIGTQTLASLVPRGSGTVSVTFATAGLNAGPRIWVWVNPASAIAESDYSNNLVMKTMKIAGLPDETPAAGTDLVLSPTGVTFNDECTSTVYLISSPTVIMGVLVANAGNTAAGSFRVTVRDGQQQIAAQTVPGLAGQGLVVLRFPWNPASGAHSLTVTADADGTVSETDESNNAVTLAVDVIGGSCAIIVKKLLPDGTTAEPPFAAYEIARFQVATAYSPTEARTVVSVSDAAGNPTGNAALPLAGAGQFQWNVMNQSPGTYRATASFSDTASGALLDSASAEFAVQETVSLRSLKAAVSRDIVEGGNITPVDVRVTLANGSNVESTWALSWRLFSPAGQEVLHSAQAENVVLPAVQKSRTLTLAQQITGQLAASGLYTLTVSAAHGEDAPVTATATFNVLPSIHLNVLNEVIPAETAAEGQIRARTVIKLAATGEAADLNIPVTITSLTVDPAAGVTDVATSQVTVTATGVLNALGKTVADGTLLAVYVPYGTITSGTALPGTNPNPQIRLVPVSGGNMQVVWKPAGGVLTGTQRSLTVLEFHQYFAGQEKWFGKNIGHDEIFLSAP